MEKLITFIIRSWALFCVVAFMLYGLVFAYASASGQYVPGIFIGAALCAMACFLAHDYEKL